MNLRPVKVAMYGEERNGLFHKFYTKYEVMVGGDKGGQISREMALVEFNDGEVESVSISNIRFIDSDVIFNGYNWNI